MKIALLWTLGLGLAYCTIIEEIVKPDSKVSLLELEAWADLNMNIDGISASEWLISRTLRKDPIKALEYSRKYRGKLTADARPLFEQIFRAMSHVGLEPKNEVTRVLSTSNHDLLQKLGLESVEMLEIEYRDLKDLSLREIDVFLAKPTLPEEDKIRMMARKVELVAETDPAESIALGLAVLKDINASESRFEGPEMQTMVEHLTRMDLPPEQTAELVENLTTVDDKLAVDINKAMLTANDAIKEEVSKVGVAAAEASGGAPARLFVDHYKLYKSWMNADPKLAIEALIAAHKVRNAEAIQHADEDFEFIVKKGPIIEKSDSEGKGLRDYFKESELIWKDLSVDVLVNIFKKAPLSFIDSFITAFLEEASLINLRDALLEAITYQLSVGINATERHEDYFVALVAYLQLVDLATLSTHDQVLPLCEYYEKVFTSPGLKVKHIEQLKQLGMPPTMDDQLPGLYLLVSIINNASAPRSEGADSRDKYLKAGNEAIKMFVEKIGMASDVEPLVRAIDAGKASDILELWKSFDFAKFSSTNEHLRKKIVEIVAIFVSKISLESAGQLRMLKEKVAFDDVQAFDKCIQLAPDKISCLSLLMHNVDKIDMDMLKRGLDHAKISATARIAILDEIKKGDMRREAFAYLDLDTWRGDILPEAASDFAWSSFYRNAYFYFLEQVQASQDCSANLNILLDFDVTKVIRDTLPIEQTGLINVFVETSLTGVKACAEDNHETRASFIANMALLHEKFERIPTIPDKLLAQELFGQLLLKSTAPLKRVLNFFDSQRDQMDEAQIEALFSKISGIADMRLVLDRLKDDTKNLEFIRDWNSLVQLINELMIKDPVQYKTLYFEIYRALIANPSSCGQLIDPVKRDAALCFDLSYVGKQSNMLPMFNYAQHQLRCLDKETILTAFIKKLHSSQCPNSKIPAYRIFYAALASRPEEKDLERLIDFNVLAFKHQVDVFLTKKNLIIILQNARKLKKGYELELMELLDAQDSLLRGLPQSLKTFDETLRPLSEMTSRFDFKEVPSEEEIKDLKIDELDEDIEKEKFEPEGVIKRASEGPPPRGLVVINKDGVSIRVACHEVTLEELDSVDVKQIETITTRCLEVIPIDALRESFANPERLNALKCRLSRQALINMGFDLCKNLSRKQFESLFSQWARDDARHPYLALAEKDDQGLTLLSRLNNLGLGKMIHAEAYLARSDLWIEAFKDKQMVDTSEARKILASVTFDQFIKNQTIDYSKIVSEEMPWSSFALLQTPNETPCRGITEEILAQLSNLKNVGPECRYYIAMKNLKVQNDEFDTEEEDETMFIENDEYDHLDKLFNKTKNKEDIVPMTSSWSSTLLPPSKGAAAPGGSSAVGKISPLMMTAAAAGSSERIDAPEAAPETTKKPTSTLKTWIIVAIVVAAIVVLVGIGVVLYFTGVFSHMLHVGSAPQSEAV